MTFCTCLFISSSCPPHFFWVALDDLLHLFVRQLLEQNLPWHLLYLALSSVWPEKARKSLNQQLVWDFDTWLANLVLSKWRLFLLNMNFFSLFPGSTWCMSSNRLLSILFSPFFDILAVLLAIPSTFNKSNCVCWHLDVKCILIKIHGWYN